MKNISKYSIHCSSDGMRSGGILTEPELIMDAGNLASISSKAGVSASVFFCCEIYGALGILATFDCLSDWGWTIRGFTYQRHFH